MGPRAAVVRGGAATRAEQRRAERDSRAHAREYVERGWRIVRVPKGSKAPVDKGWQSRVYSVEDFAADDNIGLWLGGDLKDVDPDTPEARTAAPRLLPATDMRHGRPSARAHYWYDAAGAKTAQYRDVDGRTMLIELRAGAGQQTIVPPSTHPSGEVLAWEAFGEPAAVDPRELERRVAAVAAAAILARHSPAEGARHEMRIALAGMGLRGGMTEPDVLRFVEAAAVAAGHRDVGDCAGAVKTTAAAIATGKSATGAPRLAELLTGDGRKVVELVRQWLGLRRTESAVEIEQVTPLDVFGDATLAGSPDFPLEPMPEVLARFAEDEAERLGVDPAMLALPALAVCAAAIHDGIQVQPRIHDTGWRESARLWIAGITDSGERKSPALRAAVQPLRDIEIACFEEDQAALAEYEIDRRAYESAVKGVAQRRGKGEDVSAPTEPKKPRVRRWVCDDATIEALSDVLLDNHGGPLVFRDEFSSFFAFDAYRQQGAGRDRSLWLELYNGGWKPIDRVRRGRVLVPNWSVCLLGAIQPEPMRRLASKITDDGLVQRLVTFFPRPCTQGIDRRPNYSALTGYRELLARLVALPPSREPVTLDPDAHPWREEVARVARDVMLLPDTSAAFRAHLAKWEGLFARLLLTLHVVGSVSKTGNVAVSVSAETAAAVTRLMVDYLLPHAARFYADILGHDHLKHGRWLAGFILARRLEKLSVRSIGRAYRELRGDPIGTARVMETLEALAWVTRIETGHGGPPRKWKVNPQVHSRFADRAAKEQERRQQVFTEIQAAAGRLGLAHQADHDEEVAE